MASRRLPQKTEASAFTIARVGVIDEMYDKLYF